MSLNLQPGQTWRNRGGQFVTVEFKASERAYYMKYETQPDRAGYIVTSDGRTKRTHRSDLDLAERAERVYVSDPNAAAGALAKRYIDRGCYVCGTLEDQRDSLRKLITCETLVLLPSYDDNAWSMLELHVAEGLGLAIVWPEV